MSILLAAFLAVTYREEQVARWGPGHTDAEMMAFQKQLDDASLDIALARMQFEREQRFYVTQAIEAVREVVVNLE